MSFLKTITLAILSLSILSISAQSKKVIVLSEKKAPISYAQVTFQNKLFFSDTNGIVILPFIPKTQNNTVVVKHLGYKPLTAAYNQLKSNDTITLEDTAFDINEVEINAFNKKLIPDYFIDIWAGTESAVYLPSGFIDNNHLSWHFYVKDAPFPQQVLIKIYDASKIMKNMHYKTAIDSCIVEINRLGEWYKFEFENHDLALKDGVVISFQIIIPENKQYNVPDFAYSMKVGASYWRKPYRKDIRVLSKMGNKTPWHLKKTLLSRFSTRCKASEPPNIENYLWISIFSPSSIFFK